MNVIMTSPYQPRIGHAYGAKIKDGKMTHFESVVYLGFEEGCFTVQCTNGKCYHAKRTSPDTAVPDFTFDLATDEIK